ncbi:MULTISPECIES: SHOCT-like domain-containing protein [unclassified Sedimentibacter]|uniref:SHOCT-like domain-containing protein n=1 Tax=unclassified Sedimentibacter TaxID=2649220 RepID=UPI0027E0A4D2|nr:hypothetical protein [Sedimentibacter sp. MB35-C1]WMJ76469.1 hypothetical protein RBQ61_12635 [Sedimentibacter sp. MB35-C1]
MNEQEKILEMIENGQLTAAEAMELLNALNTPSAPDETNTALASNVSRTDYKYLKIRVTSENNTVNVNVNIPIRFLKIVGGIAGKMTSMIPKDARAEIESKGIDITNIDFKEIIDELMSGTLDDPSIVDVEAWDQEHNTTIKVKIYVE